MYFRRKIDKCEGGGEKKYPMFKYENNIILNTECSSGTEKASRAGLQILIQQFWVRSGSSFSKGSDTDSVFLKGRIRNQNHCKICNYRRFTYSLTPVKIRKTTQNTSTILTCKTVCDFYQVRSGSGSFQPGSVTLGPDP